MDPDANLREQRELTARIIRALDFSEPLRAVDVNRLAELVTALDEWLTRGGFLPVAWRQGGAR
jgi:hypothetical protein